MNFYSICCASRLAVVASASLAVSLAAPAHATTRSSFHAVGTITNATAVPSNGGLTYTVSLLAGGNFTIGANVYSITDVFGFYLLSDDVDFSPLAALGSSGTFRDDSSNSSTGGIQGWKSNPNAGITVGNSPHVFNFPANFHLAAVDRIGFHVRVNGLFPGTTGNTGNITLVPTPGVFGLMGLAGLVVARRRR